jgi:hypothetical protein
MTTNQKEDIQPKIQKPMHQQVHPFFNWNWIQSAIKKYWSKKFKQKQK